MHKSIAVKNRVKVVVDGLDGIALFNEDSVKFKNKQPDKICHFYVNINCVEEVNVYAEKYNTSLIYGVDSCKNEVIEFLYQSNLKNITGSVKIQKYFGLSTGIVTDSVRSTAGFLAVVSHSPSQINIIDLERCGGI